jgi:hypothetical protein
MIRPGLIAIALSVTLISCNGKTNRQNSDSVIKSSNPQTSIKVDKKYDYKGNLIKYDSTYSYYYSNVNNNTNLKDSIFNTFKNHFNRNYFFSTNPYFNDFFFQDSLLKYDFYRKDFFMNRFRNNMRMMDSLFWGMDSLKNSFFNKQFMLPGPVKVPKIK